MRTFWERYGGKTYEGLNPKLAIYASGVEEAATEVKPVLEKVLSDLGIPASKILLNVGDAKYTKMMISEISTILMFPVRKETKSSLLSWSRKARKVGTAVLSSA